MQSVCCMLQECNDGVTLIDLEKLTGVARNAANGAARILAVTRRRAEQQPSLAKFHERLDQHAGK